ncbi:MAG: hypothetical protein FRX48_02217 [Lasallia pustulata]|uniref:Tyrosine specific protein phosphatases domain-containing protein n=1 Tax=Lasallia pustulata TaxID=136370 RepID=A0A5M8PW38_9LECA|nr:MAG: hypothetical protein FRX48_02217 [Lasallia pustulata]
MSLLPSPPFVPVEGIHNFRDLGGYPVSTSPSKTIRRNIIFRCAEPSQITPNGIQTLQSLGVATFFDLRSGPEIEKMKARAPVVEIKGIERVFVPVFADEDYSPEQIALRYKDYASSGTGGFTRAYHDILRSAPPSYRRILLHLAEKPHQPCVIHCTAGKDRTGVLAALILELAGVDQDTIAHEYALTELGLKAWRPTVVEHLLQNPALEGNREGALNMVSARAENMLAALEMIREIYGGAEAYVKEKCGLSEEDIARIRQNILHTPSP